MNKQRQYSQMTAIGVTSVACVVFAVFAYVWRPAKFYTAEQITVHAEGIHDDGIELRFSTLGETLYSCPGVTTKIHDEVIDLYFHRVPNERNDIIAEIPSVLTPDGTFSIRIPYDIPSDGPVQIRLNGTKKLGQWSFPD